MICLNFFGGPGVGKSTAAAKMFYELKTRDVRCELVGEFAKELVYNRAYSVMGDQLYLFAEQAHRLRMLEQYGVQIAICDSPLLLAPVYGQKEDLTSLAIAENDKYNNINYVIARHDHFLKADKRSTKLSEAKQKDLQILALLRSHSIPYELIYDVLDIEPNVIDAIAKAAKQEENVKKPPMPDEPWKVA